jgi:sirohydrochlorin ferrochelatase
MLNRDVPEALRSETPAPEAATAVLLIAHGSRRSAANDDLVQLAAAVAERSRYPIVEIAYLELAEPTISAGGAECVARGARRVLLLPWFLSAGAHVVEDLEEHRRGLSEQHPRTEFVLCPPLGLHPLMIDVVLSRLEEGSRHAR